MKISTLCKIGCIGLGSVGLTCLIVATNPRFLRQMDSPHGGGGGGMVEDLFPTPSRSPGVKSPEGSEEVKPDPEKEEEKDATPESPVSVDP